MAGEQLLREGPGGAAGSVPWARGQTPFWGAINCKFLYHEGGQTLGQASWRRG